jgi:hypothetical protein
MFLSFYFIYNKSIFFHQSFFSAIQQAHCFNSREDKEQNIRSREQEKKKWNHTYI